MGYTVPLLKGHGICAWNHKPNSCPCPCPCPCSDACAQMLMHKCPCPNPESRSPTYADAFSDPRKQVQGKRQGSRQQMKQKGLTSKQAHAGAKVPSKNRRTSTSAMPQQRIDVKASARRRKSSKQEPSNQHIGNAAARNADAKG